MTESIVVNGGKVAEQLVAQQQPALNEDVDLIKSLYAKGATDNELNLFLYYANKYKLDIMSRQIWFVKFQNQPAQIYAGRDGYLAVAHRSGHFDGMQSHVNYDEQGNIESATCTVWRNDMQHPFEKTVLLKEYDTHKSIWLSKPATMITKVAESQVLRLAFDICGLYDPAEMGEEGEKAIKYQMRENDLDITPAKIEIDYSKCYPQDQFDTVLQQYQAKGWNTDEIKKAKVADGWYDKELIQKDWDKHLSEMKKQAEEKKEAEKPTFVSASVKLTDKPPKKTETVNVQTCDVISTQYFCSKCGKEISKERYDTSHLFLGKALCEDCAKKEEQK